MQSEREPGEAKGARHHLLVLVRLQELDKERDEHEGLIQGVPRLLEQRERRVEEARQAQRVAEENLKRARIAAQEREVDLRAATDDIKKTELQLNTAKTNQEYQALTHHLAKLRTESASKEDETLKLYETIEGLEAVVDRERQRVKQADGEYQEFVAACDRDKKQATSELGSTDERRRALLADLPPELLDTYNRVREARAGIAVVSAAGRLCAGCGMNLKPNDMARLMGGREILSCETCQRILYLPEALPAKV
jgi:predicted  nucleic acid-binding Zn-ribbon protein